MSDQTYIGYFCYTLIESTRRNEKLNNGYIRRVDLKI